MNVYEIDIWRGVYHNGKFSHNGRRTELIHALNKERALKKITLEPEKIYSSKHTSGVEVKASPETIYRFEKVGTVVIKPYYVYSDGRTPRPVGSH